MREKNDIEFKSTRQVWNEHQKMISQMINEDPNDSKNRNVPRIHEERFSAEMEELLEEFENEQNMFGESEPSDKDTIH